MNAATKMLSDALDHFRNGSISPGGDWTFSDDLESLCLDHRSPDGTKFWIDLQRDGTIIILWKPAGAERPEVFKFTSAA